MVHSLDFFPRKILKHFQVKSYTLFFLFALVEQLGDDSWLHVQFAVMLNWYLPLCIYIVVPACPSLMCSFNRGNDTLFENMCCCFCMYVSLRVCVGIDFVD